MADLTPIFDTEVIDTRLPVPDMRAYGKSRTHAQIIENTEADLFLSEGARVLSEFHLKIIAQSGSTMYECVVTLLNRMRKTRERIRHPEDLHAANEIALGILKITSNNMGETINSLSRELERVLRNDRRPNEKEVTRIRRDTRGFFARLFNLPLSDND